MLRPAFRLVAFVLGALLLAPTSSIAAPSATTLPQVPPESLPTLPSPAPPAEITPTCGAFCESAGIAPRTVSGNYHLDAWGNYRNPSELEASKNRFGFTGHLFDRETGTYYAKARYFDPALGRFLSQDSYLGEIDNPPSIHRYTWAHNRPTYYVDPTGNVVETAWDVFSLGLGLKSLRDSLSEGRIADAALDTLGIVADTAAVIVPGVPGGVGAALRGARGGKKLVDTLQAVDAAANATQAAGAAVEAIHEGKGGRAVLNAGMAALGAGSASRSTRQVAEEVADVGADVSRAAKRGEAAQASPAARRAEGEGATPGSPAPLLDFAKTHEAAAKYLSDGKRHLRALEGSGVANAADVQRIRGLALLQRITNRQSARLRSSPEMLDRLLSPEQLAAIADKGPWLRNMYYGSVLEKRLVAGRIARSSRLRGLFEHVGDGPGVDFLGRGALDGTRFDITTVLQQSTKPGKYGDEVLVPTYTR
ncbi:MAG: hypothetical protein KJ067_24075 [Vicinamibacteria bacterium]|nr:hypothetical protein [Vicinamibacteria bacterium]